MANKDYLVNFLTYITILFIVLFLVLYFTFGDKFGFMTKILPALVPMAYLILFFLLRFRHNRKMYKKRKEDEGSTDIVLYLSYRDKIIDELLIFLLPVIIFSFAYFKGIIDIITIFQACVVFIIMFFWHNHLFKKEE